MNHELDRFHTEQAGKPKLVEIRKSISDFESDKEFMDFRNELVSKHINPWLKKWYQDNTDIIPCGVWALVACESDDNEKVFSKTLDLADCYEDSMPDEGLMDFAEWLKIFNPGSWGDWLLVPTLFRHYHNTGQYPPALNASADPWIDGLLRESRGMLIWEYQFTKIIRVLAEVGNTTARSIYLSVLRNEPEGVGVLEKTYYPSTDQTLLQIFLERTISMQGFGGPDYILSDWLANYYSQCPGEL